MSANTDMNRNAQLITGVARLLEYPGPHTPALLQSTRQAIALVAPCARDSFERFAAEFQRLSREAQEELATATFEITPSVVPYVSVHLFGEENFQRGEFMAALSAQYAQRGFDPQGDLPDHLATLLRYMTAVETAEQHALLRFCILGPLGKMSAALNASNPYRALLETAQEVLRAIYPELAPARSPLEQMREHGDPCGSSSQGCQCSSTQTQPAPMPFVAAGRD